MDLDTPGSRIRYWRKRRGLSVPDLAARAAIGLKSLEHLESGTRQLRLIEHLNALANALHIDPADLVDLGRPRARPGPDATEIAALRAALQRREAITTLYGTAADVCPDPARLARQITYLWTAFQSSDYTALGQHLPAQLTAAQDAAAADASSDTLAVLSMTYQLAASMLWKLKEPDLAWLAAERALGLAERVGDPLLISDAARRVAHGLMATGHPADALALIRADIDRLDAGLAEADAEYLSVYGMLPLMGAVIAGRAGAHSEVRSMLAHADVVAERQGGDRNEHWTAFGPTNAAVHRTSVMVELGDGPLAVEAAAAITPDALSRLPRERRATHQLDVARAHAQSGHRTEALEHLELADATAHEEIRCRPAAHELVSELITGWPGRPPAALRQLASRIGLPT